MPCGLIKSLSADICRSMNETVCASSESTATRTQKTQLITCPACDNKLSEDSVMEALGAMRFIDDVLDKREVEQMSPANARSFIRDLLERFENLLPKVNSSELALLVYWL